MANLRYPATYILGVKGSAAEADASTYGDGSIRQFEPGTVVVLNLNRKLIYAEAGETLTAGATITIGASFTALSAAGGSDYRTFSNRTVISPNTYFWAFSSTNFGV